MNYIYYKGNQVTEEVQPIKLLQVYDNHSIIPYFKVIMVFTP